MDDVVLAIGILMAYVGAIALIYAPLFRDVRSELRKIRLMMEDSGEFDGK